MAERSEKVTALLLLLLFESSLDDSDMLALLAGARCAEPHKQRCTPWLAHFAYSERTKQAPSRGWGVVFYT